MSHARPLHNGIFHRLRVAVTSSSGRVKFSRIPRGDAGALIRAWLLGGVALRLTLRELIVVNFGDRLRRELVDGLGANKVLLGHDKECLVQTG